jgi:hypothetical protein
MSGLSPTLAVDAFELAVDGHEVTNETKNALMRVVRHLRLLRFELMALGPVYRRVRDNARCTPPS